VPIAPQSASGRKALAFALVLLGVVPGCGRDQASASASSASVGAPASTPATAPASGSAASFAPRLDSNPAGLVPLPYDSAGRELRTYRLSIAGLQRWSAAQRALNRVKSAQPSAFDALRTGPPPKTLDEMIAAMNAKPVLRGAFDHAGTTAHDYVLTMLALSQAMQGYERKLSGVRLPAGLPPSVLDNISFVEKNIAAIQQARTTIER
jgi:hypothetical protein